MRIPLITEIQRYCLQDGPGIRTTIFVKGCPLHCPWCHNPETQNLKMEFYFYENKCTRCGKCSEVCSTGASSMKVGPDNEPFLEIDREKCAGCMKCVDVCPAGARTAVGREYTIDKIAKEAVSDRLFFENSGGGVTIGGGEPLAFPEFTLKLAKRLKMDKVHVAIETSCFQKWDKIKPLLEHVDLFLIDIKKLDPKSHKETIGCPVEPILKNIEKLVESGANVRIHLPIIPDFNDSDDDFNSYIEYLRKFADRLIGVDILPFHVYGESKYDRLGLGERYVFKGVEEIPSKKVLPLAKGLKKAGIKSLTVGGLVGVANKNGSEKSQASAQREEL